ncbi:MAG: efflux RND transporter periplasmic adaptor subunit [Nitrospiraceae bacterium]|nr:efflux RND transporter periplasmic adaptor subunit [Nitrospiraceae bacterium]
MFKVITNKKILIILAVIAVLAVPTVGALRRKPIPVRVVVAKPGELRVIVNATTTSTIKSEQEVTLSAQRTGRVVQLPVKEGDRVRTGELIARLDLTEEAVQSESALSQAMATSEETQKNLKRSEELFNQGMIAQQDLDAARRAAEVALSQYQAARADVSVRQEYSVIRAPFTGVVSKKYTEVGELLLPGKQIVTIVDPERIYVLATIDEVDVGRLRVGLPVSITVDAFPGEKFSGEVRRISPIVSGGKLETRTADVWIYFSKRDDRLKPGMSADIEIQITTLENVIAVPSQAVVEREGKKQIYHVQPPDARPGSVGEARLAPVEVGESNWIATEIRKGVSPGDVIITTPEATGLKSGVKVTIEQ